MGRRLSIAAAFGLTVVVAFAIIVLGRSSGLFAGGGEGGEAAQVSVENEDLAGALEYLAAIAPAPIVAEPQVITEYVYIDEPAAPPQVTYVTRSPVAAAAVPAVAPTTQPAPQATPIAQEELQEDKPLPDPTAASQPVAHEDDDPSAEDTVGGQNEIEFIGIVTSVNGNDVTFATGGAMTTVHVTSGLDALTPGTGAKVHALWIDGSWVAKEIELNDGEDD